MRTKNARRKRKSEYEIEFWERWLNADPLKREELVGKLPFIRDYMEMRMAKLPEDMRRHMLTTFLNSFFEDLESAVYTKIRLEKNNKKRS